MQRPGKNFKVLALSAFMGGAGVSHFVNPDFFDPLVPEWMPGEPRTTTYVSGLFELAGAALVAFPRTRRLGGWWCAATLVGVFPANLQGAVDGGYEHIDGFGGTPAAAWIRLPMQIPMVMWAVSVAKDASES